MDKLCSMREAAGSVQNGTMIALGGNTLNRAPMEAVLELIRRRRQHLRLIKTAGGLDVDLLALGGCLDSVDAGFISLETEYGLAQHYRRAVQAGQVIANEHACYTVISALRAGAYGIPFMPVHGLQISDLRRVNDYFADVTDPFSGEKLAAVKALRPDVAVIHVQKADVCGNALIEGPKYDDVLMSRAAKRVIVTTEMIVDDGWFSRNEVKADVPHFMVSHVVRARLGAFPGSCFGVYEPDEQKIRQYTGLENTEQLRDLIGEVERL
jgi:glutaconate CoA-transferase subunit A